MDARKQQSVYWLVVQRTYDDCGKLSEAVSLPLVLARVAWMASNTWPLRSNLVIDTGLISVKVSHEAPVA